MHHTQRLPTSHDTTVPFATRAQRARATRQHLPGQVEEPEPLLPRWLTILAGVWFALGIAIEALILAAMLGWVD